MIKARQPNHLGGVRRYGYHPLPRFNSQAVTSRGALPPQEMTAGVSAVRAYPKACGAGDSVKLGVKRSETPGYDPPNMISPR